MAESVPAVLYVDDEAGNRLVFSRTFGKEFRVLLAATAEEALAILEKETVGLLLSDQRLPGMLGTELFAAAKERWPQVVRMALTAYSDVEIVLKALNEELACRYILKPWRARDLREMMAWGLEVHQFESRILELEAQLIESERLSTLGTLLGSITHDIRNPLAYITANVETLTETQHAVEAWIDALRAEPELAAALALPEAARVLAAVGELPDLVSETKYGIGLLNSMVQGIQNQGRSSDAPSTPAPPGQTLDYARRLTQSAILHAGGRLELHVEEPLPLVTLSTVQLSQVLLNLLRNSIDALPGAKGERLIAVRASAAEGGVTIAVEDSGGGMPPEVRARAFKEFFTTKAPGHGTGLGLANCKRLVETAGGRITLDSEAGRGTTVTVWVPAVPE